MQAHGSSPKKIRLMQQGNLLGLEFEQATFELRAEYLRVYSPSAEVRGHGPGQETLVLNKSEVKITKIEAQGNYAVRLVFDDYHDSGIFTWSYLYELGENHDAMWADYLKRVAESDGGAVSALKWQP